MHGCFLEGQRRVTALKRTRVRAIALQALATTPIPPAPARGPEIPARLGALLRLLQRVEPVAEHAAGRSGGMFEQEQFGIETSDRNLIKVMRTWRTDSVRHTVRISEDLSRIARPGSGGEVWRGTAMRCSRRSGTKSVLEVFRGVTWY